MITLHTSLRALAVAAISIAAGLVTPSAARSETLEGVFRDAVKTSPDLAVRRARIDAQRASITLAYSEALPQLSTNITAQRLDRDDPARRITGTEVRDEWRVGAQASQLVFGSGRVRAAIRQARAQVEASEAAYRESVQSLLLQTAQAFAEVREARAVAAAQQATLENLKGQRDYVFANQRAGFLTLTDVAQADARIAASQSQLARAKAEVVSAERAFARLVGRPPGELERPDNLSTLPTDYEAALSLAIARRQSLEAARKSEKAADAGVDAAHAGGRPRLALEANSFLDNGFEFEDDDRLIEDYVALRMTIPIFSGGANRARARQQRALRAAARQEIAIAHRDVAQGVATALADLEAAQAAEVAAQEEIRAAELALRGIRREQQSGLRSVIDVLDQEQDLLSARLSLARAESDRIFAERSLQFQIGALECQTCDMPPS